MPVKKERLYLVELEGYQFLTWAKSPGAARLDVLEELNCTARLATDEDMDHHVQMGGYIPKPPIDPYLAYWITVPGFSPVAVAAQSPGKAQGFVYRDTKDLGYIYEFTQLKVHRAKKHDLAAFRLNKTGYIRDAQGLVIQTTTE